MADMSKVRQDLRSCHRSLSLQETPAPEEAIPNLQGKITQLRTSATDKVWENERLLNLTKDEDMSFLAEKGMLSGDTGWQLEPQSGIAVNDPFPTSLPLDPRSVTDVPFSNLLNSCSQSISRNVSNSPVPLTSLVNSLSTEMEWNNNSFLRPQPLLGLVKSMSVEFSHLESKVALSKSDSKSNVPLWRPITQRRTKQGDSKTAPSSPSISPSKNKGGFFNVQEVEAKLEHTRRKLSESMQEPLSMLSKIVGDDAFISPRHKQANSGVSIQESDVTSTRPNLGKVEGERLSVPEYTYRSWKRAAQKEHFPVEQEWEPTLSCCYTIRSYGDMIQVLEVESKPKEATLLQAKESLASQACTAIPCKALACVAVLVYSYFVLPLPSYISGLSLGFAVGLMLGFLIIVLFVPGTSSSDRKTPVQQEMLQKDVSWKKSHNPDTLKGWMNELYSYDPEIYHPSLTHSVFVTLKGSTMKLSYPMNNIPRQATFQEEIPEPTFIKQQCYDLSNAKVFLFPLSLARKRLWNKKYPICILFADQANASCRFPRAPAGECEGGTDMVAPCGTSYTQLPSAAAGGQQAVARYLFGRTGREKEEWYQHLLAASRGDRVDRVDSESAGRGEMKPGLHLKQLHSPSRKVRHSSGGSRGSTKDISSLFKLKDADVNVRQKVLLDYNSYMSRLVQSKSLEESRILSEPHTTWINALIGRIFWDFFHKKYWADKVSIKIQKKLSKIKLPYFMKELTLTGVDLGASLPLILSASYPTVTERGLWLDMDISYSGLVEMTLETKMDLRKLGKEISPEESRQTEAVKDGMRPPWALSLADSDEESSSAGSSDEDVLPVEMPGILRDRLLPPKTNSHVNRNSASRKILHIMATIAKSKYFLKATENEFIKKKIEEMSSTPLLLTVELQELKGTLVVNIPPPPTDRIWYSFRVPPRLEMKVRPKLGGREVTFLHVTEWIEKKLKQEFEKMLVMPNMDDVFLPIMHSSMDVHHLNTGGVSKAFHLDLQKKL